MKTYEQVAKRLTELLADPHQCVRLHVEGYMPLVAEDIGHSGDGRRLIALSHTAVQNGDLMRDPEIVFELHEAEGFSAAEPVSFRNDFTATMQEVYTYDDHGKRTGIRVALKSELRSFARTWFRNLRDQGS